MRSAFTTALLAGAASWPAGAADTPLAIPLRPESLAGLPRSDADLTAHGQRQRCEGVALADLLARAGAPSGEALRGTALTLVVIAKGRDGYRVAFSLGEIDSRLGNRPVLIADRCDGQPLPAADGPLRLVVPGDARAARSVRQLVRLDIAQTVAEQK